MNHNAALYWPELGHHAQHRPAIPRRRPMDGGWPGLAIFLAEIRTLAAHLKYSRQPFQNQEDWPSGARSVLLILGRSGAQTVPEIARERGTSRQNIQIVVNRLKTAGLADSFAATMSSAKPDPTNRRPTPNLAGLEGSLRPRRIQSHANTGAKLMMNSGCSDWK